MQAFYHTGRKFPNKGSIMDPLMLTKKMKFGITMVTR